MLTMSLRNLLAIGALIPMFTLAACPDEERRPIGSSCSAASQCDGGLCYGGSCLDPEADDDIDGLLNAVEAALGTDPLSADTDGDGQTDLEEVGSNVVVPLDSDGDGKSDANESSVLDNDGDCIPDQLDQDDAVKEIDPAVLGQKICRTLGVCSATGVVITANCAELEAGPQAACDYGLVPDYEGPETSCDELDNDCDGVVDNAFVAGGTSTFTDVDGTPDLVKGDACGIGACAGGMVVCGTTTTLACSSTGNASAELCDASDNDCDGETDEGEDQSDCTDFYLDFDKDTFGDPDVSVCQCSAPVGDYVTVAMDCNDQLDTFNPDAAGICGLDADCDTFAQDADEVCDDANEVATDGCDACTVEDFRVNPVGTDAQRIAVAADGADAYIVAYVEPTVLIPQGPGLPAGPTGLPELVMRRYSVGVVEPTNDLRATLDATPELVQIVRRGDDRFGVVLGFSTYDPQTLSYSARVIVYDIGGTLEPTPITLLSRDGFLDRVSFVGTGDVGITIVVAESSDNGNRVYAQTLDGENKLGAKVTLTTSSFEGFNEIVAARATDGTALVGWVRGGKRGDVDEFLRLTTTGQPDGEVTSLLPTFDGYINGMELLSRPGNAGFWLAVNQYEQVGGSTIKAYPVTAALVAGTPTAIAGPENSEGGGGIAVNGLGQVIVLWSDY
ncbi:MAG: hypothetical protein ACI9MR_002722, partial [Myxococcota bacterium]